MEIERLRKIIKYSTDNRYEIESEVKKFYSFLGLSNDTEVLNFLQIIRPAFQNIGYIVLEIPFDDKEIGALCYKGDALGYIVINTSLAKVNVNFALCHEFYHAFCEREGFKPKVEFSNNSYFDNENEYAANLFAGDVLMPETSFRRMHSKFMEESEGDSVDTVIRLMSYYQAPYMSVLVRCYELNLFYNNSVNDELLHFDQSLHKA